MQLESFFLLLLLPIIIWTVEIQEFLNVGALAKHCWTSLISPLPCHKFTLWETEKNANNKSQHVESCNKKSIRKKTTQLHNFQTTISLKFTLFDLFYILWCYNIRFKFYFNGSYVPDQNQNFQLTNFQSLPNSGIPAAWCCRHCVLPWGMWNSKICSLTNLRGLQRSFIYTEVTL